MRNLVLAALICLPGALAAQESDEQWLAGCRQNNWRDRGPYVCDIQVTTIPAKSRVTVRPGENSAVNFVAYNGKEIEIHARITADGRSDEDARAIARGVQINTSDVISATGPALDRRRHWWVSFVVFVPRNTDLVAETDNGPISVRDVVGHMELNAQNGPISLHGVGGDVRAHAVNGPIHVELTGSHWNGAGLDAATENGPVSLEIPDGYNAELETGTTNGPIQTEFPVQVTLSGRSSLRHLNTTLGKGGAPVRVVTVNGPLTLRRP